ncbi:MAG: 30S ribosome-binding factor RbfA [Bacteroidota bacterium]
MSIRTERVARLVQREVATLLNTTFYEVSQSMLTVTGCRVTPDLSMAYVYVSSMGDARQRKVALNRLQDMTPRIRAELGRRVRHQLRKVPALKFFLDESLDHAQNIERLLDKIRADREERGGSADAEGADPANPDLGDSDLRSEA